MMMGKRKRVHTTHLLEDSERGMYKTFSSAANAVSLLYSQSQLQQKRSFFLGMRAAYEKTLAVLEASGRRDDGATIEKMRQELAATEAELEAVELASLQLTGVV